MASKGLCPKCGSLKGFVTYLDGHAHCFSMGCGHWVPASGGDAPTKMTTAAFTPSDLIPLADQVFPSSGLTKRRLAHATLRRYGYFTLNDRQFAPYYDQDGELSAQKVRDPSKNFSVLKGPGYKSLGECRLFGHQVYGDRFDRTIVIAEGELDAMSVAQAKDFKIACVSIGTGIAGAAKHLKANYLWVDRYEEIILWFDDDEPGRAGVEECAKLFKVGKVKVARAPGFKDASECLQADKPGAITEALFMATAWRPKGIVNAADARADVLSQDVKEKPFDYPAFMPNLQAMTRGIHLGEVSYHVAGTGVGKSSILREVQYDLALRQGIKIAILSFEDTRRDMQLGLMSIHCGERLQLIDMPDPEDTEARRLYDAKMAPIHAAVFSGRLVELFDPETAEWSFDAILGYIRYIAKALDCQVIFIDPLSFIAALTGAGDDERRALDRIAAEMARLAKELHVALVISHHLKRTMGTPHEEGAATSLNELRSSGGLANFAVCVVGWERNNQADGDAWRVTRSRVLKQHRLVGIAGLADTLYYQECGKHIPSPIPFPPPGKPEGAAGEDDDGAVRRRGGFSPRPSHSEAY